MDQEDSNSNNKKSQSQNNKKRKRIKSDLNNSKYIYHVYSRIKKIYPNLTQSIVSKMLSRYFELAQEDLSKGNSIDLGGMLGDLYLVKVKKSVYINKEGELVNELPIDRNKTKALWKENPELKGKTFVRHVNNHSDGFLFKLKYDKFRFALKNKSIYHFKFSRTLKSRLSERILNKEAQAYEIQTNHE